jgi:hypothetical protein
MRVAIATGQGSIREIKGMARHPCWLFALRALAEDSASYHPVFKLLRHLEISSRQFGKLFAEFEILSSSGLLPIMDGFLPSVYRWLHDAPPAVSEP